MWPSFCINCLLYAYRVYMVCTIENKDSRQGSNCLSDVYRKSIEIEPFSTNPLFLLTDGEICGIPLEKLPIWS